MVKKHCNRNDRGRRRWNKLIAAKIAKYALFTVKENRWGLDYARTLTDHACDFPNNITKTLRTMEKKTTKYTLKCLKNTLFDTHGPEQAGRTGDSFAIPEILRIISVTASTCRRNTKNCMIIHQWNYRWQHKASSMWYFSSGHSVPSSFQAVPHCKEPAVA
jgi:hypothetical protein